MLIEIDIRRNTIQRLKTKAKWMSFDQCCYYLSFYSGRYDFYIHTFFYFLLMIPLLLLFYSNGQKKAVAQRMRSSKCTREFHNEFETFFLIPTKLHNHSLGFWYEIMIILNENFSRNFFFVYVWELSFWIVWKEYAD